MSERQEATLRKISFVSFRGNSIALNASCLKRGPSVSTVFVKTVLCQVPHASQIESFAVEAKGRISFGHWSRKVMSRCPSI